MKGDNKSAFTPIFGRLNDVALTDKCYPAYCVFSKPELVPKKLIPAIVILRALLIVCKNLLFKELLWHRCAVLSDTVLHVKCCLVYCLSIKENGFTVHRTPGSLFQHTALLPRGAAGFYKSHLSPQFEVVTSSPGAEARPHRLQSSPGCHCKLCSPVKQQQLKCKSRPEEGNRKHGSHRAGLVEPNPLLIAAQTPQNKPLHSAEPPEAPAVMQNHFKASLYQWKFLI